MNPLNNDQLTGRNDAYMVDINGEPYEIRASSLIELYDKIKSIEFMKNDLAAIMVQLEAYNVRVKPQ